MAVGFLDEKRIAIGSHDGLAIFDADHGTRVRRQADPSGGYTWFRDSPPTIVYTDEHGEHLVEAAGLWGGALPQTTDDGWSARIDRACALLVGPDGTEVRVEDDDEPRACGFSPRGRIFIFATSATLYVSTRLTG